MFHRATIRLQLSVIMAHCIGFLDEAFGTHNLNYVPFQYLLIQHHWLISFNYWLNGTALNVVYD